MRRFKNSLFFIIDACLEKMSARGEVTTMTSRTRFLAALFASLLPFTVPSLSQAQTDAPTASDLTAKVEELQRELEDVRAQLAALKKDGSAPSAAAAATATATAATAPAAGSSSTSLASLLGPTSLSGFVDTYYAYNSNQPTSRTSGFRSFDGQANQFALNLVELVVDKQPVATSS